MPSSFINHIVASSKVQKRPLASSNSRARVAANTAKFKAREGVHLKIFLSWRGHHQELR